MKATGSSGELVPIEECYISIDGATIKMKVLPDISDSKSASYNDEPIIGRSFPMKTYSHSENRTISWTAHFIVCKKADIEQNIKDLYLIAGCVYPEEGEPYSPPPICQIKCGKLLAEDELCVVLRSYSVKFPTEVAWDEETMVPYKFDVDMTWEVVYSTEELPNAGDIFSSGG